MRAEPRARPPIPSPASKVRRPSDVAVAGIDDTLLWWRSLKGVEQANLSHVTSLVKTCEDLFDSERQAWVSAAIANAALNKQAEGEEPKGQADRSSAK